MGIVAGNPAATIIERAMLIMIVSWFAGYIVGTVALRAVNEKISAYRNAHPIPSDGDGVDGVGEDGSESLQDAASQSGMAT